MSRGRCQDHCAPLSVVRIGAVRVRLSPVAVPRSSGGGCGDCCCGVPWPRSRIPLPSSQPSSPSPGHTPTTAATSVATAAQSNNSRGIFSRGAPPASAPPPVYRSNLEWRQCFGRDRSAEDAERLIADPEDPRTLDRLLKSRFGGGDRGRGAKRNPPHKKKPRTTDKTERLRELTEKLKTPPRGEAGPSTSVGVKSNPPLTAIPEPKPNSIGPASDQREPTPAEDDLFECVNLKLPKPESRTIVGSYIQRTIPFRSASFSQVDFSPVDGKYIRSGRGASSGSKIPSLGTSSVCLTLPRKKTPDTSPSSTSLASSTTIIDATESSNPSLDSVVGSSEWIFPKVSPHQPSPQEPHQKPPNTRSLTHPLTGRVPSTEEEIPYRSIDGNGLKSLVLPVPERPLEELREESDLTGAVTDPLSVAQVKTQSADSTNAQELSHCRLAEVEIKVIEETEHRVPFSDRPTTSPDSTTDKLSDPVQPTNEDGNPINNQSVEGGSSENVQILTNRKNVENNIIENKLGGNDNGKVEPGSKSDRNETNADTEHPSSKTFVTKWPEGNVPFSGDVKIIHTDFSLLKDVELPKQINEETKVEDIEITGEHPKGLKKQASLECPPASPCVEDKGNEDTKQRWSDDTTSGYRTSSEWPSSPQEEPQSPDESGGRIHWPRSPDRRWLERPRLVCQSSEERDDESVNRGSPKRYHPLGRNDSLSEGESDNGDRRPTTPSRERDGTASPSMFGPSDQSDSEGRFINANFPRSPHAARRYSKRPLRGPYGQMLEAEMKKPDTNRKFSKLRDDELKFLENFSQPLTSAPSRSRAVDDCLLKRSYTSPETPLLSTSARTSPKRKVSANIPFSAPNPPTSIGDERPVVHIRTTSSPSQLEGCASARPPPQPPQPSPQLLAQLLKGSSERALAAPESPSPLAISPLHHHWKDTRTHVVVELYETEKSYVEALQTLVIKYLQPLKSSENANLVDAALVDEIFRKVPDILEHHEKFLEQLKNRLEHWDVHQRVGDIFLETFSKQSVIDTYTAFVNNWKTAKEAIKITSQAKPAFARFLEALAREHKGKLALDSLLIMPVQRIPRYELLIGNLLKHTEVGHRDHVLLREAQREVHSLAVRINCVERDSTELTHLENLIEGDVHLVVPERTFLRHDLVTMASGQGRKERALFLFSDLLIITSIKRRSGTISGRKPSTNCPGTIASTLENNKYKLLMRIPLDDLEIVKEKDDSVRRLLREMEHLRQDVAALSQMSELAAALHCPHSELEANILSMHAALSKRLAERQNTESQLSNLELMLNTQNGVENLSLSFSKPDKRTSWEETLNDAKQRLALSADKRLCPEFVVPVPIRKTRAGLQFTCAAATLGARDVWVCNSDGYVGQVCVLSLDPEPTVTSCNGVCNARILCISAVPAPTHHKNHGERNQCSVNSNISISVEDTDKSNMQLESTSSSSSEEDGEGDGEDEDCDHQQPTMWLGTEDGCIHVYNSSDNIRVKKNKVKIQHGSAVHSIIYLDNRVFVALANGDISVYTRDSSGVWDTASPCSVSVGSVASPVTRMVPVAGRLWCSCHNTVKVLNTSSLSIEHQLNCGGGGGGVGGEGQQRSVSCLAAAGLAVWLSLQHSAAVRLFHATNYDCLAEVNIAPAVTKMLASCDDIIRQHKAACLRVTALLACQDLLWIGTSAGVVLTLPLPHVTPATTKVSCATQVTGMPHGHTGHVRFLTAVPGEGEADEGRPLVISGGDGYEDFRSASVSEVAGREDSTNHLLLWQT